MQRFLHCLLYLLLPAALVSCGGSHAKTPGDSAADGNGAAKKAPLVKVEHLVESNVEDRLPCTSYVEVFHEVEIPAQVPGQITAVFFDIGKIVKKGEILLRIDDREASLNLENTKAQEKEAAQRAEEASLSHEESLGNLAQAKRDLAQRRVDLKRQEDGVKQGLTIPKDLEQAELERDRAINSKELAEFSLKKAELGKRQAQTALETANIQRRIAERKLEDFTIRSPIDGIISERMVKGGEWISMQNSLCKVVDHKNLILQITRPQQQLGIIRPGQAVELEVDAWPGTKFSARIELLSPVIDRATGTFKARARIEDPQTRLRPGMFCKADIITKVSPKAIMIPKRGIFYESDEPYAFVVRDGRALRIDIERGIETKDAIEALNKGASSASSKDQAENFVVGDRVIIRSQDELKGGEAVRVAGEEANAAPTSKEGGSKAGTGDSETGSENGAAKPVSASQGKSKSSHGTELR